MAFGVDDGEPEERNEAVPGGRGVSTPDACAASLGLKGVLMTRGDECGVVGALHGHECRSGSIEARRPQNSTGARGLGCSHGPVRFEPPLVAVPGEVDGRVMGRPLLAISRDIFDILFLVSRLRLLRADHAHTVSVTSRIWN